MKVAASLSVFSLDSVAHIFGGKPWIAKYFAVGLRRTCRHLCWLLSSNPHPTGLTCIILNITRDFTSLKFWLSLKCCRFQTWQFEAQKGSIIPSDPPPQLQIPIDLKKEKKKNETNSPSREWERKQSGLWKCALIFSHSSAPLPLIQTILKVILRNLESWFTTRPCHLNQVSQWSETKVQHRSEPRERAEPSSSWQLSFSGCDLGGGSLHCSPAPSVLL